MKEKDLETGLEIAVIGMVGRFPAAGNIEIFWDNLIHGVEAFAFFSEEELRASGFQPPLLNSPHLVKTPGGLMSEIEYFDAAFFDYTPMEAEQMAPQTRIFHECLWEVLEDAGYDPGGFNGLIGRHLIILYSLSIRATRRRGLPPQPSRCVRWIWLLPPRD